MRQTVFVDLLIRYLGVLQQHAWLLIPAVLVAAVASWQMSRHPDWGGRPWLRRLSLSIVVIGAVLWAWSLCWASDDAYISYRYAENLAHGHGLVFNAGERVEGYTDFLWTVLLVPFIRLGAEPAQVAILLSLASFIALLLLLDRLSLRLSPAPVAAVALGPLLAAGSYTMASFATSGLETMFAALLVLVAVERAERRHPMQAGLAGILATLAHPDHAIFYVALGLALLADRERRRDVLAYSLPFLVVFVPYFAWRLHYYGDLMPNTFYAKSADQAYFTQGGVYLLISFISASLWAVLPLALLGCFCLRQTVTARFVLIGVPLYLVYVAKIGGDFMLGRLLTPVMTIAFLLVDVGARSALLQRRPVARAALWALATLAAIPTPVIGPGEIYNYVADERTFVPLKSFSPIETDAGGYRVGKALRREFKDLGLNPTVGLWSIGMAAFYSDLPVFDLRGLTSRSVAHKPIASRGRPGHEKTAGVAEVLEAGTDLSELPVYPPPYQNLSQLWVTGVPFSLVRYSPGLVAGLRPAAGLLDFGRHIDQAVGRLGSEGPARLACDLWHMKEYYFSRNPDPTRRQAVVEAAQRADPSIREVAGLLFEPRDPRDLGLRPVRTFSFEVAGEGWRGEGEARTWWRERAAAGHDRPFGSRGHYIDSFTSGGGDASTGVLTSQPFTIAGDVMTLLIGGGMAPADVHVDLVIDGTAVRTATGCDSDWLGRRVWDVALWRGATAVLVLTDRSPAGWGHLVVDEIVEWARPGAPPVR